MPNQLDEDLKMARNKILLEDLAKRLTAKNEALIGTMQEILVEGPSKRNSETWSGRTPNHKIVIFDPKDNVKIGDLIHVKIDSTTQHSLYGAYESHSERN